MTTLAEQLWERQRAAAEIEERLGDSLDELLGADGWDDFQTDYYDSSIEIFGVSPDLVLDDVQTGHLLQLGFDRCWTHTNLTERRQPGERSYWLKG